MDIQTVIDRALGDPIFAAELAAKAGKASKARSTQRYGGLHGDEWEDLLSEFADSPQELARMLSSATEFDDQAITTATTGTTTTTITTTTSLPCGITTTTTTTTTTTVTTTIFEAPE
jgi:hypothetical protein